jgi:polyhydroxybutyrate depolymerase
MPPRPALPVAALLLACCLAACAGGTRMAVTSQGVERWTTIDRPPPGAGPRPLLVILHAATLNGAEARSELHRQILSRSDQVAIAWPDAQAPFWNDGAFAATMPPALVSGDDLGFLDALIAHLVADGTADPGAIHIAGVSNGGMMALRYACARAGRIASVTAFMATLPRDAEEQCRPARPIDVMLVAGTADRITRWTGEVTFAGAGLLQQRLPVPETFDFWRRANGCTGLAPPAPLPLRSPAAAPHVVLHGATGCARGVTTRLYEVRGGGHRLPGDRAWPVWWPLGDATLDVEAGALLAEFALRPRAGPKS